MKTTVVGPTMMNDVGIAAGAAGSRWDQDHAGKHEGPSGQRHMGDLPVLEAAANGQAANGTAANSVLRRRR
jgi:superoxide dismutase, Cu-Zn family